MKNSPIGIFDSGIGGLTVANAIKEVMPNEDIIYFGDTEHLPYGEKSKEAIALSPATSLEHLEYVVEELDNILILTVNPGFKSYIIS